MHNFTINLLPEDFRELPVYFYTASNSFPQNTMRYDPGAQQFYQILLVLEGSGVLYCGGRSYPLTRGCAFFTAEGYPSEYVNTGGLTTAFLTARGSALPVLLAHYGYEDFLFAEHMNVEKCIADISEIIREYYEQKREGRLSAMAYQVFVDFFEAQRESTASPLEQICRYLEKHFMEKLTLARLAALSDVSVSKLCHDFKAAYGCTVFAYILNLRLTYARSYLFSDRDARTKDAALSCGFEDISYFCRAYKKKFGLRPSQDQAAYFHTGS